MSYSNQTKIVFLFGAGMSICAGMPKTYEITERVLSGEGVYYHDGYFSTQIRPYTIAKWFRRSWH